MYINTETNEYPVSEREIRNRYSTTSFSLPFQAPQPYKWVFPTPTVYDPLTQRKVEGLPELTELGHWEERWSYQTIPEDEIAAEVERKRLTSVPEQVSPRQIRQGLTAVGLRESVEYAISVSNQDTKDWYEYATVFERNNPLVIELANALNVTDRQVDDLWTLAGNL